MQRITIMPMTIDREMLREKQRTELLVYRSLVAIVALWLLASLWAFAASAERAAELAARV